MAHEEPPAGVAVPLACQVIVVPLSVPLAVPATFRPPAHVAVNEPDADVGDCCVGDHTKFVQLDGDGTGLVDADFHVPTNASTEPVVPVGVVVFDSYPTHPATAAATATAHANIERDC